MKKRPNIIFIMTDQQRFDTFSCVNEKIITPNLDKIIDNSIFFEHAYCTNPSCVPSRAAIMTGKYPSACEVPAYISYLPDHETTFMSTLQESGYYTAVIGKQHFAQSTIKKGYDFEMIVDGHAPFAPVDTIGAYGEYLKEQGLNPKEMYERTLISGGTWKVDVEHHIDYFLGERGKEWVDNRLSKKEEQPFFLTLSFPGPHHPYDLEGTKYSDMYDLKDMDLPDSQYQDLDTKGPQFKNMGMYAEIYLKDYSEETFRKTKRSYYANMTLIDEKVGELMEVLKKHDAYDDTVIIYSSDHGDFMGDYGLVEKLQCLEDSLMRVPLFMKPPIKDFMHKKVKEPVVNVDIASTCLELAEASIHEHLEDYTYNAYWDSGKELRVRPYIYLEAGAIRGVLCDGIKTIHYVDRTYGEMYDLNKDPLERVNVWDDPNYAQAKIRNYGYLVDSLYKQTSGFDTKWNIGTPEI